MTPLTAPATHAERLELFSANVFLAAWAASRWGAAAAPGWAEDVRQAALLGLWEATARWRPERGKFTTAACVWMRKEIFDELHRHDAARVPKYRTGERRAALRARVAAGPLPADDCLASRIGDPARAAEEADEKEAAAALLDGLMRRLDPTDRQILHRRMRGELLSEVGLSLGFGKERTRQRQCRAVTRLRELALGPPKKKQRLQTPRPKPTDGGNLPCPSST